MAMEEGASHGKTWGRSFQQREQRAKALRQGLLGPFQGEEGGRVAGEAGTRAHAPGVEGGLVGHPNASPCAPRGMGSLWAQGL